MRASVHPAGQCGVPCRLGRLLFALAARMEDRDIRTAVAFSAASRLPSAPPFPIRAGIAGPRGESDPPWGYVGSAAIVLYIGA